MKDIFMVIAFLLLMGLLVTRMAREPRQESAYEGPLADEGTQSGNSEEQTSTPTTNDVDRSFPSKAGQVAR